MADNWERHQNIHGTCTAGEQSREETCNEEHEEAQGYSMLNEEYWSQYRAKLQRREEKLVSRLKYIHKKYRYPRQAKVTALKELQSRVLFLRKAVDLEKEAYSKERAELDSRSDEVRAVSHRVFHHSLGALRGGHSSLRALELCREEAGELSRTRRELKGARQEMVGQSQEFLFPMEVESLTVDDEGERSVAPVAPQADLVVDIELEGEWLLSGHTHLPTPRITINGIPLPIDGNYMEYHSSGHSDPRASSAARISAGLSNVAQYVHLLQQILGTPLPYPTPLGMAVRDYGRDDLGHQTFAKRVSRLDSNLLYLCMTQHVSPQALVPRGQGTISNLFTLVSHCDVESSPSFTCYPELFSNGLRTDQSLMMDSVMDVGPPVLFPVHPSPEGSLESRSLELGTVRATLQEEFSIRPSSEVPTAPAAAGGPGPGSRSTNMAGSGGSRVIASVSGLWSSVTKYWAGPEGQ